MKVSLLLVMIIHGQIILRLLILFWNKNAMVGSDDRKTKWKTRAVFSQIFVVKPLVIRLVVIQLSVT